jgi:hypothetical protein
MGNGAESAVARAARTQYEESRRLIAEALPNIRAFGFFANGMQVVLVDDLFDLPISRPCRQTSPQPGRLACFDRLFFACFHAENGFML